MKTRERTYLQTKKDLKALDRFVPGLVNGITARNKEMRQKIQQIGEAAFNGVPMYKEGLSLTPEQIIEVQGMMCSISQAQAFLNQHGRMPTPLEGAKLYHGISVFPMVGIITDACNMANDWKFLKGYFPV